MKLKVIRLCKMSPNQFVNCFWFRAIFLFIIIPLKKRSTKEHPAQRCGVRRTWRFRTRPVAALIASPHFQPEFTFTFYWFRNIFASFLDVFKAVLKGKTKWKKKSKCAWKQLDRKQQIRDTADVLIILWLPPFPPPPFVSCLLLHYSTPLIDCEPAVVVHAFFSPFLSFFF